ncbi:MAG: DNA polymerase III subunit delta [Dehalococcoidia bacterium]|nr:MAG: DNA polymerase III subunit delta [Dehalococcoidia bacterium]
MPLHIIYGPDEFTASEALAALKSALDADGSLATNTTVLAGRGLTPQTLLQHASALPFLAPARLVVVEGLVTSLGGRRATGDTWQPLLDFVPQMPESNHVVLLEPPPKEQGDRDVVGGHALVTALKRMSNVTVTQCAALKPWRGRDGGPSEVEAWTERRARERGIAIERAGVGLLADLAGTNLRLIATELDKLAAYANGRPITAADVETMTPLAREESMFELVDAVIEGRAAPALVMLRRVLEETSETPIAVMNRVARQVRNLVRATELIEARASEQAIGEATGARGFPLTKLLRQARATSRPAAEAALRAVEAADTEVKTGKRADVLALELLVVRLAAIAAPARGQRR